MTVTKTDSTKPANGKTVYTATASCNDGTVTITGESSSKSCNTDYALNPDTGLCDPTCRGTDYKPVPSKSVNGTLHNGYCAKWKCESTSSATAGRCESKSTNSGKCIMKSDIVSSFLFKETLEETCNLAHSSSDCQRAIAPLQSLCRDYDRGSRGNGFEDHGFVWVDYKKISTIV